MEKGYYTAIPFGMLKHKVNMRPLESRGLALILRYIGMVERFIVRGGELINEGKGPEGKSLQVKALSILNKGVLIISVEDFIKFIDGSKTTTRKSATDNIKKAVKKLQSDCFIDIEYTDQNGHKRERSYSIIKYIDYPKEKKAEQLIKIELDPEWYRY